MTLVVTLKLDADSQKYFEDLRQLYFPTELNRVPAHLTLFHQLPWSEPVVEILRDVAGRQSGMELKAAGLRSLGRGVAYTIESPALLGLHRELAERLDEFLIPQDKQRFKPHIVVQNKATTESARALMVKLTGEFAPRIIVGQGLEIWEYLGGPWRHIQTLLFGL